MSVIIPARNAEATLASQLSALARQTYEGAWEVIVVDNNSSDQTAELARSFGHCLPSLRVVTASDRPGVGYARNRGIDASRGDLLAFCDADDVVSESWLRSLVAAASTYDLVGGVNDYSSLNHGDLVTGRVFAGNASPDDETQLVPGGNCAIWREVFKFVGLWNEGLRYGGEDNDLTIRARQAGMRIAFRVEGALVNYRFKTSHREILKQSFFYARSGVWIKRERGEFVTWGDTLHLIGGTLLLLIRIAPKALRTRSGRARIVRLAGRCAGHLAGRVATP